jgi:mono/diheme cytochrome c family protein
MKSMHNPSSNLPPLPLALLLGALTLPGLAASSVAAEAVDFNRDIRPILAGSCFKCHGPDEATRKAGLRLDERDAALQAARSGERAIVPGELEASELLRRVTTSDEDDLMPPPKDGERLSPEQVARLKQWISEGATYRKHWAYEQPVTPALPEVQQTGWPRTALDYFVLARLEAEGLTPAPEAPRTTLIRRLSFDLTGLPPTPEEVAEFVNDPEPRAYERLVERLLGSPHYGERWARPWLDLARYADTNGYEADYRRSIWPYRDWVINALNADLPFDQFTIEQLAGDLLPNPTREQKIATGFHRNTMVNTEGGTDDEEFRTAALVDRVNTTFSVWLGSTMACAQCHTHKYDPFTINEYYQALAILDQTTDKGKANAPELSLPTPEQKKKQDEINALIKPLQARLDTQTTELDAAQNDWEAGLRARWQKLSAAWQVLQPVTMSTTNGVTLEQLADGSIFAGGELPDNSLYEISTTSDEVDRQAFRLEALTDERLPHNSSGRHEEGDFTVTDFRVLVESADGTAVEQVPFNLAWADFSMNGYDVRRAVDSSDTTGWAIAAYEEKNRTNRYAIFVADRPFGFGPGSRYTIRIHQNSSRAQHLLGRFRLSLADGDPADHRALSEVPDRIRWLVLAGTPERGEDQRKEVAKHFRSITPLLADTRKQLEELRKQLPKNIPTTLVLEAVKEPRETHVMLRGNFLNKGEKVTPGVPAVLHPWPEGEPVNRLTFARWLVSPDNPLVGRVTMNRLWETLFGAGIVLTSEEFGSQGEPPSHPEMLDWLATEFVRNGWSLKAMKRAIVTSATYRQAAVATPEKLERDPFNRLFSRGPRFRMEAEMLRDYTLAVSGLLDRTVGGPSVFPHQPEGVWNNPYSSDRWELSQDGDQFRRGLYTFWRRTSPYASFMAFDAPSREVACERRTRSNTPVQSLVTLNDPAFVVAANSLARHVVALGGDTFADRLDYAVLRTLARHANREELAEFGRLFAASRVKFENDSKAAEQLVSIGLPKPDEGDIAELAAWMVVANVLLNLDEALTKG